MSRVIAVLVSLTIALSSACSHVALGPVPARTAGPLERVGAYNALRAAGHATDVHVAVTKTYVSVNTEQRLILASGVSVEHADDLLPVLDSTTPAARAAHRSGKARRTKFVWATAAITMLAVGTAMLFMSHQDDPDCDVLVAPCDYTNEAMLWGAVGASVVGALGGIGYWYYGRVEHRERSVAFATYDESLRTSLGLCVEGLQVVACEGMAPAAPAPPPAAPDLPPAAPTPAPPSPPADEDTMPFPGSAPVPTPSDDEDASR